MLPGWHKVSFSRRIILPIGESLFTFFASLTNANHYLMELIK